MRTKRLAIMLSSAMLFAVATTQAIDREASMIDTLWFQGASYDHSDYAGLRLTGETQIQDCGGEWAILAGIAAGELSMDEGETYDSFGLSLGIQYYVSSLSTLAVIGSYTWNSGESDLNTSAATVSIKQRLIPPSRPISPFVRVEASLQDVDSDDADNALILRATAGCDFMMSPDMALVFEGGLSEAEALSSDGTGNEDGWLMNVAMQFYWE